MGPQSEKQSVASKSSSDALRTSKDGTRTPRDGLRTPNNGIRTPRMRRHPSSILMDQMAPPTPRYYDGSMTPGTGPGTGSTTARTSRRNSFSGSMHSFASFGMMDDIKHEVMVNHLFQQQCKKLWISDVTGEIEGVVLRKTRGSYMSCPPTLINSPLAYYCSQMNVQVCLRRLFSLDLC